MHPDVAKAAKPLTKQQLKELELDTLEGKIEYAWLLCEVCGKPKVHRFSVGNDMARGVCAHSWGDRRGQEEDQHDDLPDGGAAGEAEAAP